MKDSGSDLDVELMHIEACSGVYLILNTKNSKRYIGSSANVLKRVWTHFNGKPGKASASLIAAMKKHGRESFKAYMLERAPREDLPRVEAAWIKYFEPAYNRSSLTETGGRVVATATREKLRQANLGKKMAPHLVEAMRQRLKGHPVSDETRDKIAASHRGLGHGEGAKSKLRADWATRDHSERIAKMAKAATGRKASPETRAKMSAAHKARVISPELRAKMIAAMKVTKALNRLPPDEVAARRKASHAKYRAKKRAAKARDKEYRL